MKKVDRDPFSNGTEHMMFEERCCDKCITNTDPITGAVSREFDINPFSYAMNTSRAMDPKASYRRNYCGFNILDELDKNYIDVKVTDLKFQGDLSYKPIRGLEFTALGAIRYYTSRQEHNITDQSNQARAYRAGIDPEDNTIRENNSFLYEDPDNPLALPETVLPEGGIYNLTEYTLLSYDFRGTVSYNRDLGRNGDHIISLFGGSELNSTDRQYTWFRGWGMQYSLGEIANYAYEVFKKGAEENTQYYKLENTHERRAAFFGTATYSYKGRYTVNGTIRYEGSNKLGKSRDSRWLPTWNVSGAWNAHEEPWFEKRFRNILSHATLKASYSLTAESGPSWVTNSLPVITSYNPWRPFSGVRESGLEESDRANGELTFEKKHELNLGFQLGFFDNRINFEFDWYKRNNYDLIGIVNTQMGGQKYGNVASMKSNGVEMSLTTTNIKTSDFTWTTNIIYSHTHNEVTKLENNQRVIDLITGSGFTMEGYPVRSLFSIPFKGLTNEGLPLFLDQDGEITSTGIYFQTREKEKMDFLEYSGSVDPTDVGSLGNLFKYKSLSLNVFITYSFGNVVRLDPVFKNVYNDLNSMPKEFANRWVVPGDEEKTTIPVIASRRQNRNDSDLSYAYNAYNYSTERVAKGDFIRMKEISLGYEFPKLVTDPLKINSLSLKLQATNLFLIYADKKLNGQDPEFFNTGGVAVPLPKQFTLTLRLGI